VSEEGTKEPVPWQHSNAKKLLEKDIIDGKLDGMKAKDVHLLRPEHQAHKCNNFCTNLKNLREKFAELSARAKEDADALARDSALNLRVNHKPHAVAKHCG